MIRIGQARRPIREKAADLKGEVCATCFGMRCQGLGSLAEESLAIAFSATLV
jgi:hypothetical protein